MSEEEKDHSPIPEDVENAAAAWTWKIDRGLTPEEQDAFFDWLAADPIHSEALADHRSNWQRLDALGDWRPEHSEQPNPDLLDSIATEPSWWRRKRIWMPLAAAACVTLIAWFAIQSSVPGVGSESSQIATTAKAVPTRLSLEDGSVIKLKGEARVATQFSEEERRVILQRGEAFFMVAKDPKRPFVVVSQGVAIRALGTAFNVRLDNDACEILVTEGRVQVDSEKSPDFVPVPELNNEVPVLEALQRAVVPLGGAPEIFDVQAVSRREIGEALSWQHDLLTFESAPLVDIVNELNHLNETQLVIEDETLASMEFQGTFRSDNLDGFVRLLELGFGVFASKNADGNIVIRKDRS